MKYFNELPKIEYPDENGVLISTPDLMVRFTFLEKVTRNKQAVYEYLWKDGDTPDKVARAYYGNHDMAWLVMMSGQLFDWTEDLPIRSSVFTDYLETKYGKTIEELSAMVHHYEDADGFIVDEFSGGAPVSVFLYEDRLNEKKRTVKLVSKDLVPAIRKEFRQKLQAVRDAREEAGV